MLRRVKPSRCVDARAENEADVIRCHVFRLDALHTDQLLQAEVLRFMERPKAGFYKNPVFSLQIHHITDLAMATNSRKRKLCSFGIPAFASIVWISFHATAAPQRPGNG